MIKLTVAEGLAALDRRNQQEGTPGRRAVGLIERPDFDVRLYAPIGADYPQTPHVRDELYVIASGSGKFTLGDETETCAEGDMLFVAGGAEHGFSELSPDFSTWVIFLGPAPSRSTSAARP
jgi:mannose-6-phosphate isomerase-like protein (cupin superfamily)